MCILSGDLESCSEIAALIEDIQDDPDEFCLEVEDQLVDGEEEVPAGFGIEVTEDPEVVEGATGAAGTGAAGGGGVGEASASSAAAAAAPAALEAAGNASGSKMFGGFGGLASAMTMNPAKLANMAKKNMEKMQNAVADMDAAASTIDPQQSLEAEMREREEAAKLKAKIDDATKRQERILRDQV